MSAAVWELSGTVYRPTGLPPIGATVAAELARLLGPIAAAELLASAAADIPFPHATRLLLDAGGTSGAAYWEMTRP
jgi:hypothetical protein